MRIQRRAGGRSRASSPTHDACVRATHIGSCRSAHNRGSSLLEAMAAAGIATLVLGGAAEQARRACATVREARTVSAALTAARNVLEFALATPCTSSQDATSLCPATLSCTISGREIARRSDISGTTIVLHLTVEVRDSSGAVAAPRLARLVAIAARPETCS